MVQRVFLAIQLHRGMGIRAADGGTGTAFTFQPRLLGIRRCELQRQQCIEGLGYIRQGHPILRSTRTGQAGLHGTHVQVQAVGKRRLVARLAPQSLRLAIRLDPLHHRIRTAAEAQIPQSFLIHREETAGRTVLRRHVGNGRAIRQRQVGETITVEFNKLADYALAAQHLGNGQHQIGGGDALAQTAGQFETDHFRDQHRNRLPEHGRLGLDTADAPAQYAQPVDHGGVRVSADQGIRPGPLLTVHLGGPNGLGQVLQIDLVTNAGARRHHAKVLKGLLPPAQECVTLTVTLHLDFDVVMKGRVAGKAINHHRVVDDQIDRRQRIDLLRIATSPRNRITHGGQIHDRRHPGKVLHQHPRRTVLNFTVGSTLLQPLTYGANIIQRDRLAILITQQILQQHLERLGQLLYAAQAGGRALQRVVLVVLAGYIQLIERTQAIGLGHAINLLAPARCRHGLLYSAARFGEASGRGPRRWHVIFQN